MKFQDSQNFKTEAFLRINPFVQISTIIWQFIELNIFK